MVSHGLSTDEEALLLPMDLFRGNGQWRNATVPTYERTATSSENCFGGLISWATTRRSDGERVVAITTG